MASFSTLGMAFALAAGCRRSRQDHGVGSLQFANDLLICAGSQQLHFVAEAGICYLFLDYREKRSIPKQAALESDTSLP